MVCCSGRCSIKAISPMQKWLKCIPTTAMFVTAVNSPQSTMHTFWLCLKLTNFWSDIFQTLTQALNTNLELNPLTALFGLPLNKKLAFTSLLARRIILIKWKHVSPLTHNCWIHNILRCLQLEKLRFSRMGSLSASHPTL